jgi:nitrate/TMAO reductase-like tetraheme cytochrome c subunit
MAMTIRRKKHPQRYLLWRLALALVSLLALVQCSIQQKHLTEVGFSTPTSAECGKCHIEIYREWQVSDHAQAWTAPAFIETTYDYQTKSCLNCHAPESVFTNGEEPELRNFSREEGVSCLSCHLFEGAHHGPLEVGAIIPHAVSAPDPFYRTAEFCGTCHRHTFESWQANRTVDPQQRVCQECHMPQVKQKMVQAKGLLSAAFVLLHPQHELRRHTFSAEPVVEFEGALALEAQRVEHGLELRIRNGLPHPIPTGGYGYRHARLTVELKSKDGELVQSLTRDFLRDLQTELPPGETVVWEIAVDRQDVDAMDFRLETMMENGKVNWIIARGTIEVRDLR